MILLLVKYYSSDHVSEDKIKETCATQGGEEKCKRGLMWKPEGKKPLGIPRHKLDNVKIYFN